jgi:hypothetical protein
LHSISPLIVAEDFLRLIYAARGAFQAYPRCKTPPSEGAILRPEEERQQDRPRLTASSSRTGVQIASVQFPSPDLPLAGLCCIAQTAQLIPVVIRVSPGIGSNSEQSGEPSKSCRICCGTRCVILQRLRTFDCRKSQAQDPRQYGNSPPLPGLFPLSTGTSTTETMHANSYATSASFGVFGITALIFNV